VVSLRLPVLGAVFTLLVIPAGPGRAAASNDGIAPADSVLPVPLVPVAGPDSSLQWRAPVLEIRAPRLRRQEILDRQAPFASVVRRSSWSGGLETAASVLDDVAGVTVREAGGLGAYSTVSVRGSTPAQVPVYLDGVPLGAPENGTTNLADIPLDSVERIEVYRGAAPLVLGGASLGGAIHLFSSTAAAPLHSRMALGSYGTWTLELGGSTREGPWTLNARGRYLQSEGNWSYDFDNRTPYNPRDDFRTARVNNDTSGGGGLISLRREGARWRLEASGLLDGRVYGIPGRDLQAERSRGSTLTQQVRLALSPVRPHRQRLHRIEIFERLDRQGFTDLEGELGLGRQERVDRTWSVGAAAVGALRPTGDASWRLEARWARLRSEVTAPTPREGEPQDRWTLAAALQPVWRAWDGRLALSPGARVEWHRDRTHALADYGNRDLPAGAASTGTTTASTLQAGARLVLAEGLLLKANLGRYERVPTLLERFGNRGTVIGNPDLESERGWNRDVGLVLGGGPRRPRLALGLFHNDSSALIAFVRNSQRTATAQNIGAAEVTGLEIEFDLGRLGPLGGGVDGTWLSTRDRSDAKAFAGRPLPGRPEHEITARFDLDRGRWRLDWKTTAVGENTLDRHGREIVPARVVHALGLRLDVGPVVVDARVENLTDREDLFDLYGWPLPGRRFLLSLRTGGDLGR
jgi:iron complex outermembrane receptor protein